MLRNRKDAWRWQVILLGCIAGAALILTLSEVGQDRVKNYSAVALQSQQVYDQLAKLTTKLVDAETAQRGFLLTHDLAFLAPYRPALKHIKEIIPQLSMYYSRQGDVVPDSRMSDIAELVAKRTGTMELILMLANNGQWQQAESLIKTGVGLRDMESIRLLVEQLQNEQKNKSLSDIAKFQKALDAMRVSIDGTTILNIVLLGLVMLWLRGETRRMEAREAAHESIVNERTDQLARLASRLQEAAENEKTRLGTELHDDLGSILTAAKMDLSWVHSKMQSDQSGLREKIARAMKNLEHGIVIKRRIIEGLRPTTLASFGLMTAARELVEQTADLAHWKVNLELQDTEPDLTEEVEIALFRILQEALNNAVKYAKATTIRVSLMCTKGEYCKLEVEDNGVGFRQRDVKLKAAGLIGMQERLRARGGHLDIESNPGRGTLVRAMLPLSVTSTDRRKAAEKVATDDTE